MAITNNKFNSNDTEYFLFHKPYFLNENEAVVVSLSNMFSIDVVPNGTDVIINDGFGIENGFEFGVSVRNLTNNINLSFEINFGNLFINPFNSGQRIHIFQLPPQNKTDINFVSNRDKIDTAPVGAVISENVSITVRNEASTTVAIRNISIVPFPQITLPSEINLI